MIRRTAPLVVALACTVALLIAVPAAGASPTVTLSSTAARPGQRVVVTLEGWSVRAVTVWICGNLAYRASVDCDLSGGEGIGMARSGPTVFGLTVRLPPVPCPCVVRAADDRQELVADAPLTIIGAAEAPVVKGRDPQALIDVRVDVEPAPSGPVGWARRLLGGRTPYTVEVTVTNTSGAPVSVAEVSGTVGKTGDDPSTFEMPGPGVVPPGERGVSRGTTDLTTPVAGRYTWEVVAYGAGPPVRAETTSRTFPTGLILLLALLGADLAGFAVLRVRRRVAEEEVEVTDPGSPKTLAEAPA